MILEVDLPLDELTEESIEVSHSSDSVGVKAGIGGRSLFNRSEMRGPEGVAASKREVWQGWNRKGTVEAKEDLDFEVIGKVTVGSNGCGKLVFLFEGCFPSNGLFAGDRARTINNCQVLLLHFYEVAGNW